jgi:CHAT domain-containing protein
MNWNLGLRGVERVLIVLAGMLCIYLGYLLFVKGVSGKASLRAEFNKSKVQLVNAMPGIFFALFGAAVLIFMIRQAVTFDAAIPTTSQPATSVFQPLPKTLEEAQAIKEVLESNGVKGVELIESDDASKQDTLNKLKEGKYVILHIATHGPPPEQTEQQKQAAKSPDEK